MQLVQSIIELETGFKPMYLRPIGDIQHGAIGCAFDSFKEFVREGEAKKAWYVGMGDMIDLASPSNRSKLKSAGLYDVVFSSLEDAADKWTSDIEQVLEPTIGRWLGMVEGHHTWEFADGEHAGETVDTRLAKFVDAPFLGNSALIKVIFKDRLNKQEASVIIFVHHGVGSGALSGAPLNTLDRIAAGIDADIYLMGHQHKLVGARVSRLQWVQPPKQEPRLFARQISLACTGGYLRGYTQNSRNNGRTGGGYVEQKLLKPTGIGGIEIQLTPVIEDGFAHVESKILI